MRIFDAENDKVLNSIVLYLTPAEAAELANSARDLADNPVHHHHHVLMGGAAVLVGAYVAPARHAIVAHLLTVVALLVAVISVVTGPLPLPVILPLATAFVIGAAFAAIAVGRAQANGEPSDTRVELAR